MKISMRSFVSSILILMLVVSTFNFHIHKVNAASLTDISDTQTNQTSGALSSHSITFATPTGIGTSSTTVLTFDNGTSISGITSADVSIYVNGIIATSTFGAAGPTTWGFSNTSNTITVTAPSTGTPASASSSIVIIVGSQVSGGTDRILNGAVGITTLTIGGSITDGGYANLFVVVNSIINITAAVVPTITFSISSNTLQFGALTTGAARYATSTAGGSSIDTTAHTLILSTNSTSGFNITFQGTTLTASSGAIAPLVVAATSSLPGTEQFGLNSDISGGMGTSVGANYATPSLFYFGATATTTDLLGSGNSPTTAVTYSVHYIANISGSTHSGSYSSNITYIATPQY
jgi:hypothetical protein